MLHPFPSIKTNHRTPVRQWLAARTGQTLQILGCTVAALALAGCASDYDTSRYHKSRETTQADAHRHAQGQRGTMAPPQLQIGFGDSDKKRRDASQTDAAEGAGTVAQAQPLPRPLRQPQTFLGTMPCLTSDPGCPASRVTLTFSPSGEWRARTQALDTSSPHQPVAQQGCWEVISTDPLRIILRSSHDSTQAAFQFVNDALLRVYRFNDVAPTLDYHLTRQPDIDPIDELANEPPLNCRPN